MTKSRFLTFRFFRSGEQIDRFGEIDFRGGCTLHAQPARHRDWIVREGPAQGSTTIPILEVSDGGTHVRPVPLRTTVLWTRRHGGPENLTSHTHGEWIPADEIDYLLLQVLASDLRIRVDTNPVVRGLHEDDRDRYANTRNLGFTTPPPPPSPRLEIDP